jgi:hypothetical protein
VIIAQNQSTNLLGSSVPCFDICIYVVEVECIILDIYNHCVYINRGIFKIDGKEYISLVGHLSTKSCEKVWKLSKSLPPTVKVEMVSRLVVWPRIWKVSEPSSDNIGLYFLPHNMR